MLFIGVALETSILYFICGTHTHTKRKIYINEFRALDTKSDDDVNSNFQLEQMAARCVVTVCAVYFAPQLVCIVCAICTEDRPKNDVERRREEKKKEKTNEKKKFHQLPTAIVCNYKMIIIISYKKWAAQRRRAVHIKRCEMEAEEEKTEIKSHTKLNM